MWVPQANQSLRFLHKGYLLPFREWVIKYFERCITVKVDMLTQVDYGEAASSQQPHHPVIAQVLTNKIVHCFSSPGLQRHPEKLGHIINS